MAFLQAHGGDYQRLRITWALRPVNLEENREILRELAGAADPDSRCFLIGLAGDLPLPENAFDVIAPWMNRQHPAALRRAAMQACARINPPAATQRLLPSLHLAEPELAAVLELLSSSGAETRDERVVEALLTLSGEMREAAFMEANAGPHEVQRELQAALRRYAHPRLAAFYFHWLAEGKPPAADDPDDVAENLRSLLGMRWSREQLAAWWRWQQAVLEPVYHLPADQDLTRWLAAYQGADETARHLLLRWWIDAPGTNQLALVQAATVAQTADTARAALAALWHGDPVPAERDHLSDEAKQALFEKFLKVELVDQAGIKGHRFKDQHELAIMGACNFPFYDYICYHASIVVDGRTAGESLAGVALEPNLKQWRFGSQGGYVPGQSASATLEIFQLEHYPDAKKLWQARWDLGPIPLPHNP